MNLRLVLWAARVGARWSALPEPARRLAGRTAQRAVGRLARTSVDRATTELETVAVERLPTHLAEVVLALPDPVRRIGGTALVAGRAARTAGDTATTTTRTARTVAVTGQRAGRRLNDGVRRVHALPDELRADAGAEVSSALRLLRSRYLAATLGPDAATDALLDVRPDPGDRPGDGCGDAAVSDAHDLTPPPVTRGRRRSVGLRRQLPGRPSRTYQPSPRPWD